MNKQEIYDYLTKKNISFEITEHKAVFTMEEAAQIDIPYPDSDAKNLSLCDDKKRNYYLVTVKGDKKTDLKAFREKFNTRSLKFASADDMKKIIDITPGSVTPLALLNDDEKKVRLFLDSSFIENPEIIGVHPNDNTATIWLKTSDLIDVIRTHGNDVTLFDL